MSFTLPFSELSKTDTHSAGGKGASLGEMTQAGIPVPPGFVITTNAFDNFILETKLHHEIQAQLDGLNHHELENIQKASESIQALILDAKIPETITQGLLSAYRDLGAEFVAVRSSATVEDGADASWAGELDSFLNTTETNLLENVQRCWASLFTPRALYYRFENGFHSSKVSVAVVVQKMVHAEVSGIAFSVHPVTEDHNQLVIEAGFGLGEAIVSGSITPDNYVVQKNNWEIIDQYVTTQHKKLIKAETGGSAWIEISSSEGEMQKLPENKIKELANLVVTIENHYGFPCDIEWAMENNVLYIVQSRPITTLQKKRFNPYTQSTSNAKIAIEFMGSL